MYVYEFAASSPRTECELAADTVRTRGELGRQAPGTARAGSELGANWGRTRGELGRTRSVRGCFLCEYSASSPEFVASSLREPSEIPWEKRVEALPAPARSRAPLQHPNARVLARETWYTSRRRIDTPFVTARSRPDPRVSVHPPPTARRKPDCSFSRYVLVHRSSIRCVVMRTVTPGIHLIDVATHFVDESGTSESIEACKR